MSVFVAPGKGGGKLRSLIFEDRNTNAFPAIFTVIFVALHEMFVIEKLSIADYDRAKVAITNLTRRIDTSRKATAADERRKNIDTIKGIVNPCFVKTDPAASIYFDLKTLDLDEYIRRSNMELANYELKQGIVSLGNSRTINTELLDRVVATICAIANNGPDRGGHILIGVSDDDGDTDRIKELDGVQPRPIGGRSVVGVAREARVLGITLEDYHGMIRRHIDQAGLSQPLKSAVLSSIDFNNYYGLGVMVISIPAQQEPSYFNDEIYWRDGDNTLRADSAKLIADISRRF